LPVQSAVPVTVRGPARFLEELAAHLAAHPDALTSGSSAAVLADFLGIHVNTAVRWVDYARQDWTAYLAARDADLNSAPDSPTKPGKQDATA
jgi:hypothetical protein